MLHWRRSRRWLRATTIALPSALGLVACKATTEASTAATQKRWRELLAALGELLLVDDPASDAAQRLANERLDTAKAKLEAARAARSQAEAVAKAGAEAQARVAARQTEVEHHAHKLRDLDTALAQLEAAVERLRGERAGKLERQAELLAVVGDALASWAIDALGAPQQQALADARRVIAELDSGAIATGAPHRVSALSADALAILARGRRVVADLAAVWNRHATVVGDVDAALADVLAASDNVAREAERAVAEQLARRDAAQARRETLRGAQRQHTGWRLRATQRGSTATSCAACSVASPVVSRCSRSSSMRSIARSIARARWSPSVAGSSRITAAAQPLAHGALDDAKQVAELAAAVAGADHRAETLAATLAADADARARRTAALAQLAAAEHDAEVDRVLGQVIGSHDGKLFRSFAQSLTLDGLLAVANSHLEELAPRYQLERVPKHDSSFR